MNVKVGRETACFRLGLWRTSHGSVRKSWARLDDLTLDAADEQLMRGQLRRSWERVEHGTRRYAGVRARDSPGAAVGHQELDEVNHRRGGDGL